MNRNTTALMCAYARSYHIKNSNIKIFKDYYSGFILSEKEQNDIYNYLKNGISFFNSKYIGNNPVNWIINNQIGPSIFAREAFNQKHLINEIKLGLKQYLVIASGYETTSYMFNDKLTIYEIDKKEIINDKIKRINNANIDTKNIIYVDADFCDNWIIKLLDSNFDKSKKTFCSLLGISYYLPKELFEKLIIDISNIIPMGSAIVFDYPNNNITEKEIINKKLAEGANEKMLSNYSFNEIELIAEKANMLVYENSNNKDIDNNYFYDYNTINLDNKILAPKGISYSLLVKR